MSTKIEQIEKIIEEFYNENWRALEDGYADMTPWAEKIDALYNKPVSSDMRFPIRLLNERLRNYKQLFKKLSRIKKTETANSLTRIIERKDKEIESLQQAISVLKRVS
jgi:polyhydroxyalkanoate synthesis regulator protein